MDNILTGYILISFNHVYCEKVIVMVADVAVDAYHVFMLPSSMLYN